MVQKDLDGNDILKEVIETVKTIYHGKYFDLTVSEAGVVKLDKLKEDGKDTRQWIACQMKLKESLIQGQEGKCFQNDLETLKNMLDEEE